MFLHVFDSAQQLISSGRCTIIFMRPSSLGGGRILRRTLSVCPSVCPYVRLSLPSVTSFRQPLASRMYFSARTEGRISYGHLGRTNSCYNRMWPIVLLRNRLAVRPHPVRLNTPDHVACEPKSRVSG